ncbi:MAG: hypothetical protein H0X63_00420 [Flavobacteriales bacterium]|nr:hypothetical protein [Flavobacteriales bacterium]
MRPQIVKIVAILFITFFVTISSWGQRVPPPPQRSDGPPPFPELPIDSGLSLLLILGIVLGLFFVLRKERT